jgi:hypothetical protein
MREGPENKEAQGLNLIGYRYVRIGPRPRRTELIRVTEHFEFGVLPAIHHIPNTVHHHRKGSGTAQPSHSDYSCVGHCHDWHGIRERLENYGWDACAIGNYGGTNHTNDLRLVGFCTNATGRLVFSRVVFTCSVLGTADVRLCV